MTGQPKTEDQQKPIVLKWALVAAGASVALTTGAVFAGLALDHHLNGEAQKAFCDAAKLKIAPDNLQIELKEPIGEGPLVATFIYYGTDKEIPAIVPGNQICSFHEPVEIEAASPTTP